MVDDAEATIHSTAPQVTAVGSARRHSARVPDLLLYPLQERMVVARVPSCGARRRQQRSGCRAESSSAGAPSRSGRRRGVGWLACVRGGSGRSVDVTLGCGRPATHDDNVDMVRVHPLARCPAVVRTRPARVGVRRKRILGLGATDGAKVPGRHTVHRTRRRGRRRGGRGGS